MKIGIVASQYEEIERLVESVEHKQVVEVCGRVFYEYKQDELDIVAVFSHWGKVAAALTVSLLLERFKPDVLISVGTSCAVIPELAVGDVVVGQRLFQHDMDMRPIFRRYEVPLSGVTSYATQEHEQRWAADAVHNLLKQSKELRRDLLAYNISTPKLQLGDMACGDLLIAGAARKAAINRNLPSVVCVDMECAAMAQVCADFAVPCVFVRIVTDAANEVNDDEAVVRFKTDFSARYDVALLHSMLDLYQ
ncbi:MAG: 5'-methylthioadenosine/adenosylhomocysteine nucleosidase [Paludibacteraceae bacterium]